MEGRQKSRGRIEPSFDDDDEPDDEFRLDEDERIAGGRHQSRKTVRKKDPKSKQKLSGQSKRNSSRRKTGLFGWLRGLIYWTIVLGIWGGIAVLGVVGYYAASMPTASSWTIPERPPNLKIVASDGVLLANRGTTGGEALALEDMSPFLPQAVIAIEDRRFNSHFGVDPVGLARALVTNLISGRTVQGGSTITQQLAKNLFLSAERTIDRKIQEVLLAFWLEHKFTKDQIMAMYLNRVYFGSNAYGVEAASRRYFNKPAKDVTLGEAALLAGLLKAPSRLSPARDPQAAEERAQVVLQTMMQSGFISESDAATAMSQPPTKAKRYWSGAEHYAADMVMDEVKRLIGDVTQDLTVETTIDLTLEKAAEAALSDAISKEGGKLGVSQGAIVTIDGNGAIKAVVGGADYASSQFNRATKAKRQPGSAFKPFVYLAALENGLSPYTIRNDAPVRFGKWAPENYDQKFRGEVTLTSALSNSLNTIAAQLTVEAGPERVVQLAHRMGIESDLQANASISLGTSEVTLLELTAAYAPLMNGGFKATTHVVKRITDSDGKTVYENKYDNPPRVLSEDIAITMNFMMRDVVQNGTGKAAQVKSLEIGGKTGTTQSFRDALFVGYTNSYATGVWFGNDDGTSMKKVTGGGLPARTFKNYVSATKSLQGSAPLFGLSSEAPQSEQPVNPAQNSEPDTIMDMISDAVNNAINAEHSGQANQSDHVFPEFPPAPPPRPNPQFEPQYQPQPGYDDGPIPPGEIGAGNGDEPSNARRTTLLDFLSGN
jgi:penicillin-binding protein 1A